MTRMSTGNCLQDNGISVWLSPEEPTDESTRIQVDATRRNAPEQFIKSTSRLLYIYTEVHTCLSVSYLWRVYHLLFSGSRGVSAAHPATHHSIVVAVSPLLGI